MRTMISTGFRLTAIASLGFWWAWLMGGAAYYYTIEQASMWESFTSGAGISLVIMICGVFSAMISDYSLRACLTTLIQPIAVL